MNETMGLKPGESAVLARTVTLPFSVIEAVARARGMSVLALLAKIGERLVDSALDGDTDAIRLVRELSVGPLLGHLHRIRSAKALHRRLLRGLHQGVLTPAEVKHLAPLVDQRQRLEHDETLEEVRAAKATIEVIRRGTRDND